MQKKPKQTKRQRPMILQQELLLLRDSWMKRRELVALERRLVERFLADLECGAAVEAGPLRLRRGVRWSGARLVHFVTVR